MKRKTKKWLAFVLAVIITCTAASAATMLSSAQEEELPAVDDEMEVFAVQSKLAGVKWDINPKFVFFDKSGETPAKYYYEPTQSEMDRAYGYHTIPSDARDFCTVYVSSSDTRVMKIDEKTKRLIPVGNGQAVLTVKAVMDGAGESIVCDDALTVTVSGSPYTPVTGVNIAVNNNLTNSSDVKIRSATEMILNYKKNLYLLPDVPKDAQGTLDQKTAVITLDDGRPIAVYEEPDIRWFSTDEETLIVDSDGKVTAIGPGKADIILQVHDNASGPYTSRRTIKVSLTLNEAIEGFLANMIKFKFKLMLRYFVAIWDIIVAVK